MFEYIRLGAIIIACIAVVLFIYWIVKNVQTVKSSITDTSWKGVLEAVIQVLEKKLQEKDIIDSQSPEQIKKEKITKRKLKTFYYLDEAQILYLLPQIKKETFKLTKIETNQSRISNLGANLPVGKVGSNHNDSTKEIYERKNDDIVSMYQEIEHHFFTENEIRFGIEEIHKESINYSISLFKEKCAELKPFNYIISEEQQDSHIKEYGNKMAEEVIQYLSKITGFVAMELDVKLHEIKDDIYILTYRHPINDYLLDTNKELFFKLLCPKPSLTKNGITVLQTGRRFNITMLGKITGWDEDNKVLEITPISIY